LNDGRQILNVPEGFWHGEWLHRAGPAVFMPLSP
jgi:hypothetical protein